MIQRREGELMNYTTDPSLILLIVLSGTVAVIVIIVVLIRWLFRINEIVALLKDIRNALCPQNLILKDKDNVPHQLCEGCGRNFQKICLKKIASGQLLCPECVSNLKKGSKK
jgi:hypothetical protein